MIFIVDILYTFYFTSRLCAYIMSFPLSNAWNRIVFQLLTYLIVSGLNGMWFWNLLWCVRGWDDSEGKSTCLKPWQPAFNPSTDMAEEKDSARTFPSENGMLSKKIDAKQFNLYYILPIWHSLMLLTRSTKTVIFIPQL